MKARLAPHPSPPLPDDTTDCARSRLFFFYSSFVKLVALSTVYLFCLIAFRGGRHYYYYTGKSNLASRIIEIFPPLSRIFHQEMMSVISYRRLVVMAMALLAQTQIVFAFSPGRPSTSHGRCDTPLSMGLFDGIAKAFSNNDYKTQDQRVRASHILIKGDDSDQVLGTIRNLMGEIQARAGEGGEPLPQVFAELARRESQCPSKDQGGDLGMFGEGKMVKEFDLALFPEDTSLAPPVGNIVGPVITDFGAHIIFVTKRDENKDQVEEKLARIDPDAAM